MGRAEDLEAARRKFGFTTTPTPVAPSKKLAYALAYARHGMAVFPCHNIEADRECSCGKLQCASAGKHPRNKGWQAEATTDEQQIRRWWAETPDANVGVACGGKSGVTVLDVDGDAGRETLRELELEHGELPVTPLAITGSGGNHYYFRYEPGVGNAVRFAPGLDIRTEGGLVIGVGSATKRPYLWEVSAQLGDNLLPSKMPEWLVEAIKAAEGGGKNGGTVRVSETPLAEGEGRNAELYKVGRSNKARGFSYEAHEASLRALNAHYKDPFSKAELDAIITHTWAQRDRANFALSNGNGKPADVPALPQIFIRNKIEILTWGGLRERRQTHTQNWVVNGWLARGETSMWSGKVEHGKTTLMRELTLCKVRGEPFLGHDCPPGRVFYAMLDADGEDLTYDEFEKMGMTDEDEASIRFLFEPMIARMENGPEQFFHALWEWRPDIVIIDPFARLKEIGDFNDYNNTYLMAMLSQYAKIVNAHFALPGHIPRGRPAGSSAATAAFGSVAFGAGVNARFVVERKEGTDIHVLRTSKGKSAGFEAMEGDQVLVRDPYTGRISLGKPFSFGHQAAALKGKVLEVINEAPLQDWTPAALGKEMGQPPGLIRAALGMLFDDGKVDRSGTGKRGDKYQFQKQIQRGENATENRGENDSENDWFRK